MEERQSVCQMIIERAILKSHYFKTSLKISSLSVLIKLKNRFRKNRLGQMRKQSSHQKTMAFQKSDAAQGVAYSDGSAAKLLNSGTT